MPTMISRCAVLSSRSFADSLLDSYFHRAPTSLLLCARRCNSTRTHARKGIPPNELEKLLAKPTWSVESLLPPRTRTPNTTTVTSKQLHHLLRLSALPPPATPKQEQRMLDTLAAQLHFVGKIQEVDTTGVEPLRALRDESGAAEDEQTISLATLKDALNKEKIIGTHYKRIQRDTSAIDAEHDENWDVLGSAERKAGKYFVVESKRPSE